MLAVMGKFTVNVDLFEFLSKKFANVRGGGIVALAKTYLLRIHVKAFKSIINNKLKNEKNRVGLNPNNVYCEWLQKRN
jgi:hypothetical protein